MIDDLPLNLFESFHENCEQDDEQNESFELEAGNDEEHLVLSNSIPTSEARRGRPLNDRWLFQANHPQYFSHLIIRRSFTVVPVLIGPAIPRRDREDTAERYARAILTLFYSWRSPLDVCDLDQTWCDALKVREATFTARSNKVINNIQLLHDCKRDRDSDLFQLVNQPLPSRPVNTSSPYNDAAIEDAEEILALLDESNHLNPSSLNKQAIEGDDLRARMKQEYLRMTLANVIRSERFSYITDITGLPDFVFNNIKSSSSEINDNNNLVRTANEYDIQKIKMWQYNLKSQKEEKRKILLHGSQVEQIEKKNQLVSSSHNGNIQFFSVILLWVHPVYVSITLCGAGGCGKSRVTEAISAFMCFHNRLHTLRSLAPSSAAAVGINGLTMQSMLREGRNKLSTNAILTQTDIATIETKWRNIDYCLIDEISMVGCHMLARFHKITTIAKHTQPSVPFGGINMIFLGDFIQYPPVLDRPLCANLLSSKETLDDTLNLTKQVEKRRNVSGRDIQCKVGRALWLQVNKGCFLTEQMRNKDPLFMAMQARLRNVECNDDDYEMLCKRVVSPENDVKSLREAPWNSATMLVFRNEVRTNINNYCVFDESKKSNHLPMVLVANDRVRNHEIDSVDLRHFLLSIPDNKTEGLPGYLPIVKNMPVLITHNIATELHISNGSIGRLVCLVMDPDENSYDNNDIDDPNFPNNAIYIRKPLYTLVEIPQSKLSSSLTGLQPTIIPIMPEQKTIKVDIKGLMSPSQKKLLNNKKNITICRTQLPIVPAYTLKKKGTLRNQKRI
ncbi:unnamed protein product [Rotaria sp. Silwood1]|nr:unnamed protein product [Rotaria sp. Silwood1]